MIDQSPPIRALLLAALFGMLMLGGGVFYGVNLAVDRAVTLDAEQKARDWSEYFIRSTPRLDTLLLTGTLDGEQLAIVQMAETVGDVFRFKLFDEAGGLVLVSDEAVYKAEQVAIRETSESAEAVARTGMANISLKDGAGKVNRPPLYVEAYVPMFASNGAIKGVVEVYIDQTQSAMMFRHTFAQLSAILAVVAAIAFGLPTLGFILRARQAQESKRRIEFLAHHDPLTGLLNRGSFNERLEQQLRSKDAAGRLAVAFVDIDNFKTINDGHGHAAGDEVLRHVARSISSCLGPHDFAARAGGDEFTILLATGSRIVAEARLERIMRALHELVVFQRRPIASRASAGLYLVEGVDESLVDVVHKADVALYQAKIDGGNCVRFFSTQMERDLKLRAELEATIRDALANEAFEVHYQPLLNTSTLRCAGFEALLRLPDGKGGFISPSTFIPIAEAIGLISEIGAWVLRSATRTAANWPGELFVSVNLSVRQFHDGNLVETVRHALESSGLDARRLELEVTESMLMENTEQIVAQLTVLRELGVSIAMDDFGTGYSSLGYLWQFGFDKLKIDRSFIAALDDHGEQARDILDTIIMLGHKLEMTVTAEGIETEHQANILSGLACDHFQGYLYGKPAPATDVAALLLRNAKEIAEPTSVRAVA